jgi:hypothetical protein
VAVKLFWVANRFQLQEHFPADLRRSSAQIFAESKQSFLLIFSINEGLKALKVIVCDFGVGIHTTSLREVK